jgi:glucose uptake protein
MFSTIGYSPFVITFPIGGSPAVIADYFKGGLRGHILGVLGGIVLCAGALAGNIVLGSTAARLLGPTWILGLTQAAPLVAMLWGVIVWREFRGAVLSVSSFLWGAFLLYAVGVALVAFAPLYGSH